VTIHFSSLKRFSQSPRHYRDGLDTPRECTRAMRIGTAVHRLILGGTLPPVYDGKRQGGDWKAFADGAGCPIDEIMTATEMRDAAALAEAAGHHPTVAAYTEGARFEVPLEWTIDGFECSTYGIDILHPDRHGDLKTVPTCKPGKLERHCEQMMYHAQVAWYDMALDALGYAPRTKPPFLLCVEQKRPHDVVALELTPDTLERGRQMCHAWLNELRVCTDGDVWPGYTLAPIAWNLYGFEADSEEVDE
jgi:hypothetical protein